MALLPSIFVFVFTFWIVFVFVFTAYLYFRIVFVSRRHIYLPEKFSFEMWMTCSRSSSNPNQQHLKFISTRISHFHFQLHSIQSVKEIHLVDMKEIHFWYKWKKYTFGRNKINTLGRNLFLWWVDLCPPGEPGAMLPDKIQFQCEFLLQCQICWNWFRIFPHETLLRQYTLENKNRLL